MMMKYVEKPHAIAPISPYSHFTFIASISIINPTIIINSKLDGDGSPKPYTLVIHENSPFDG